MTRDDSPDGVDTLPEPGFEEVCAEHGTPVDLIDGCERCREEGERE